MFSFRFCPFNVCVVSTQQRLSVFSFYRREVGVLCWWWIRGFLGPIELSDTKQHAHHKTTTRRHTKRQHWANVVD